MCWVWPFKACPSCRGTGRQSAPIGRSFRWCRRCDGTGARLRFGRWLYNHLTRLRKEGTR